MSLTDENLTRKIFSMANMFNTWKVFARLIRQKLVFVKNLQTKYFIGKNFPGYGTVFTVCVFVFILGEWDILGQNRRAFLPYQWQWLCGHHEVRHAGLLPVCDSVCVCFAYCHLFSVITSLTLMGRMSQIRDTPFQLQKTDVTHMWQA